MYKRQKITIEYVQDFDKTYCANVSVDGKLIKGITENVGWRALQQSIKKELSEQCSICHLLHSSKQFDWEQLGRKRYAVINAST